MTHHTTRLIRLSCLLLLLAVIAAGVVYTRKIRVVSLNQHLLESSPFKSGRSPSQEADNNFICDGRFRLALLGITTEVPADCFIHVPPYASHPLSGVLETMPSAPQLLTENQLHGVRLLSLGEGHPNLLNYLLSVGVDAFGLDRVDHAAEVSAGQNHRYIVGDATDFASMPFAAGGFRHIVSVMLFCCMGTPLSIQSLELQVGLLERGGTLRHAFWNHENVKADDGTLVDLIRGLQALALIHRTEYDLHIGLYFTQPSRASTDGNRMEVPGSFPLIAEKRAPRG